MQTVKKILRVAVNVLSTVVILFAVFVLLTVLLSHGSKAPSVLGYSAFRVVSGSMEPTLPTDTMIFVHRVEPEDVEVGDVISFISSDPSLDGNVNTHRVVAVTEEDGELAFQTKGDANNMPDVYLTKGSDLIGVLVFSSPVLGKIVRLASNPLIFAPLIVVPLLVMLILNMVKSVKLTKKMTDEELKNDPTDTM